MVERQLRIRLQPIAARARLLDLWRNLGLGWGLAFLAAACLWWLRSNGEAFSMISLALVLFLVVGATGWAFFRFTQFTLNYKEIALRLAEKHPEFRALLLAAVEQKTTGVDGRLSYLQERVVEEAINHAKRHQWVQAISSKQLLFTVSISLWMGIGFLFCLYGSMRIAEPSVPPSLIADKGVDEVATPYQVLVEPGDTEVEKGSGLVVMAIFEGPVPAESTLVLAGGTEGEWRLPMSRNLGDPVFGVRIPEITLDTIYHIEFPGGHSETFQVKTYEHPALVVADARILSPEYTRIPARVVKDVRTISMVEGAEVVFTLTLNKPVMGGWFTPKDGDPVPLQQDLARPNVYTVSLSPTKSTRYQLDLMDDDGRRNKLPPRFNVDIMTNKLAKLKVLFPRGDKRVSPLQEIGFEAEISDDFGLGAYGLTYSLPGVATREMVLGNASKGLAYKAKAEHLLALEDLKVEPDQLLTWYFWAEDVGPDGQVRRNRGDMFFAEVRPFEEIYREGIPPSSSEAPGEEAGNIGEKLVQNQKIIINATWKLKRQADTAIPKNYLQDVEVIRQAQAQLRQESEEAMESLDDPDMAAALGNAVEYMKSAMDRLEQAADKKEAGPLDPALVAEQGAYAQLLKLRAREHQVSMAQQGKGKGQSSSQPNQEQLRNLDLRKKEQRYETANQEQQAQDKEKREDRQALSRLSELARRQNDLAEKLKDLQAALQEARTEEERRELERQLKRLREEQRRMLSDVDELQQRMKKPENQERSRQASKQLDRTREKMTQASEALRNQDVDKALNSSSRAQKELKELEEDYRKKVSGRFSAEMKKMRDDARQLDGDQKKLAGDLQKQREARGRRLVDDGEPEKLADRTIQQKERVGDLLQQMKEVSEQSEVSEPLLSRKLYDSLRTNSNGQLEKSLETAGELLSRSLLPQAEAPTRLALEGTGRLREDVEEAAESVLGDSRESLRRAQGELQELLDEVKNEIAGKSEERERQDSDNPSPDGQARPAKSGEASEQSSSPDSRDAKSGQEEGGQASAQPGGENKEQPGSEPQSGEGTPQEGSESPGQSEQASAQPGGESKGQTGKQPGSEPESGGEGTPQEDSESPGQSEQASAQPGGESKGQTGKQPGSEPQSGEGTPQEDSQSPGQSEQASAQPGSESKGQPGKPGGESQSGKGSPQENSQASGQPPQSSAFSRTPLKGKAGSQNPFENIGNNTGGPMTGRDFMEWSDRLRDVEEMVDSRELRNRAATIRDEARSIRMEFKRHGKEPEWNLVEDRIARPLSELRDLVREELMKLESDDIPVPVDRDPVPDRFSDLVKKYYEQLGKGE